MRANMMKDIIQHGVDDFTRLTIGEALKLKDVFGLTNLEAIYIFLGGMRRGDV